MFAGWVQARFDSSHIKHSACYPSLSLFHLFCSTKTQKTLLLDLNKKPMRILIEGLGKNHILTLLEELSYRSNGSTTNLYSFIERLIFYQKNVISVMFFATLSILLGQ
jgi:hypothetical protein